MKNLSKFLRRYFPKIPLAVSSKYPSPPPIPESAIDTTAKCAAIDRFVSAIKSFIHSVTWM